MWSQIKQKSDCLCYFIQSVISVNQIQYANTIRLIQNLTYIIKQLLMRKSQTNDSNVHTPKLSQRRYQSFINPTSNPTFNLGNHPSNLPNSNQNALRKKNSEIEGSTNNYGKQQNIITNLRSQLTNLKQQVAKLMYKDTVQSQIVQTDRTKDFSPMTLVLGGSKPNRPFNPILSKVQSTETKPQSNEIANNLILRRNSEIDKNDTNKIQFDSRNQGTKSFFDSQRLNLELKNSYNRQKQLLLENKSLMETLSKQRSNKQYQRGFQNKGLYLEQIDQLKNIQKQMQYQLETKNRMLESERQRTYNVQSQFLQKLTEANNQISIKGKQINELKKQLIEERKKKQSASENINKAEPDYSEINRLKHKLAQLQSTNQFLAKQVAQLTEQINHKDNQLKYLQGVIQSNSEQKNLKINQLKLKNSELETNLDDKAVELTKFGKDIQNLKTEKEVINQKSILQRKKYQKQKQELELKVASHQQKIQELVKNLKQNQLLLLNVNIQSSKKREEDQKLKSEIKARQKTISNLASDVKHLQHDIRHLNFTKGLNKSMQFYIQELNQATIISQIRNLNSKYQTKEFDLIR